MINLNGLQVIFYSGGMRRVGISDVRIQIDGDRASISLDGVAIPANATQMQFVGNIEVSGHGAASLYTAVIPLEKAGSHE